MDTNIFAGVKDVGFPVSTSPTRSMPARPLRTAKLGPVVVKGFILSDRAATFFSGFSADVRRTRFSPN